MEEKTKQQELMFKKAADIEGQKKHMPEQGTYETWALADDIFQPVFFIKNKLNKKRGVTPWSLCMFGVVYLGAYAVFCY